MPVSVYESLELSALQLNMSVNNLILSRIADNQGQTPKRMEAAERTRKIAASFPGVVAGCDIPPRVAKPAGCPECGSLSGHQKWCKR